MHSAADSRERRIRSEPGSRSTYRAEQFGKEPTRTNGPRPGGTSSRTARTDARLREHAGQRAQRDALHGSAATAERAPAPHNGRPGGRGTGTLPPAAGPATPGSHPGGQLDLLKKSTDLAAAARPALARARSPTARPRENPSGHLRSNVEDLSSQGLARARAVAARRSSSRRPGTGACETPGGPRRHSAEWKKPDIKSLPHDFPSAERPQQAGPQRQEGRGVFWGQEHVLERHRVTAAQSPAAAFTSELYADGVATSTARPLSQAPKKDARTRSPGGPHNPSLFPTAA